MNIINDLLLHLADGEVRDVRIGVFWTAVVVEVAGQPRCGLASTVRPDCHYHGSEAAIRDAGFLLGCSARTLAGLATSESPLEAAIGLATINALLPEKAELWLDVNAEAVLARYGAGKHVALVGHFPFIPRLRPQVDTLWVLEQQPRGEDLPAEAAVRVIPQADLIALTSTTLINHTFEELMALRRPSALVLLLGPSTPLSPVLFDYGIHLVSGSVVEDIPAVLQAVGQGANFRQVHQRGVRLVTMQNI